MSYKDPSSPATQGDLNDLQEGFEEVKRDQRKLEARFVDLKSRFDGQGATLAESARWIETTMGGFETKLEKTLGKYKDLLSNLSAFDFGMRLEQVEKLETQLTVGLKQLDRKLAELQVEHEVLENEVVRIAPGRQLKEGSEDE